MDLNPKEAAVNELTPWLIDPGSGTVPPLKGQMQALGVEEGSEHLNSQCFPKSSSRQRGTIL